jgi:hypothetical protein
MSSGPRAKNSATALDVSKILKANTAGSCTGIDAVTLGGDDYIALCERYEQVFRDVLRITQRPTAKLFAEGARLAFGAPRMHCQLFGERMAGAVSYCRKKGRQSITGAKLPASIRRVASFVTPSPAKGASPQPAKFWKGTRKLALRLSDTSAVTAEEGPEEQAPEDILAIYGVQRRSSSTGAARSSEDVMSVASSMHDVEDEV